MTIRTTDVHPFFAEGRGWIKASELEVGDRVQEPDGTWQSVLSTVSESHPEGFTVYNLEVGGDHTYFVEDGFGAADAVWVHNANNCGSPTPVSAPQKAKTVLAEVQTNGGRAPQGYVGGRRFCNDGRAGGQVLPTVDTNGNAITYKEYDVNPIGGGNRGAERIVVGSDGRAYYTADHYLSISLFEL